jgi:hypothetical protein
MIKRILLALLVAGAIVQTPGVAPQALASPTCTGLAATNLAAYQGCIFNSGANCQTHITGPSSNHTTCTYPDRGRDAVAEDHASRFAAHFREYGRQFRREYSRGSTDARPQRTEHHVEDLCGPLRSDLDAVAVNLDVKIANRVQSVSKAPVDRRRKPRQATSSCADATAPVVSEGVCEFTT